MKNSEYLSGFKIDPWRVIETEWTSDHSEEAESIFSLANEYMGARGMFEEGVADHTLEGCYIGGMYVKERQIYPWQRIGFPNFANTIINTTNWQRLYVDVAGERFSMQTSRYSDYQRILDMKQGLLIRELVFETSAGHQTRIRWERLVSHADPHIAAVSVSVSALNHAESIAFTCELDSRRENRDRLNSITHCRQVASSAEADDLSLLMHIQTTGQYYMHRMRVATHGMKPTHERCFQEDRRVGYTFSFVPEQGKTYRMDKIVSVWTSRPRCVPPVAIRTRC